VAGARGDHQRRGVSQKPLEFMRRIVNAITEPDDVVWEPFGGLASAAVGAPGR
jgi:DNA modification methylase